MDPTVRFLWSRQDKGEFPAADWAIALLESGFDTAAICQLTDRHLDRAWQDKLIATILNELGLIDLLRDDNLRREYERESIGEYFNGEIEGWELIQRGCDLSWDCPYDEESRFWIILADEADQHGGQGLCFKYDFVTRDFDTVLKEAILGSNRPLPKKFGTS